ncbi:MAG: hypothetical protein IBJ18_13590 [Phycisphaerales bacterium]|nr:hypothetical protein [Phycisphaerales bacterium]
MASRRGVTILEAVLSTVILGMTAVAVSSAVGYVQRSAERGKLRQHAYETANRIMLQWLDDETAMPRQDLGYFDGTYWFHWDIQVTPLVVEVPGDSVLVAPSEGQAVNLFNAQKLVTVRVYNGVPNGIGGVARGDDELALLSRTHNPIAKLSGRNPDAGIRVAGNRDRTATIMSDIFQQGAGGGGTGSGAGGTRPVTVPSGSGVGTPGGGGGGKK